MSKPIPISDDMKERIIDLYINQNKTKEEVCEILGLTNHTLSKTLKELGIRKSKEDIVSLRKQTSTDRYGVDNPAKAQEIKQKIGEKNHLNKDERVAKQKETKERVYGDSNYNNVEKGKLTKKVRYNNENYNNRSKYTQTMMDHYGVDNGFKLHSTIQHNKELIFDKLEYTDAFRQVFDDKEKAIELLTKNNLSYFDLKELFNAPYYTCQAWATKLDVRDLIAHNFECKSSYEEELFSFLQSLSINNVILNTREYLNGKEIDLYLSEYKIGIEFNGTYWHSDLYMENNYHFNKSLCAEEKEIRLIHIYEYEWTNETIKDKLKNLLKVVLEKVKNKLSAENCEIRKISSKEAEEFNNKFHLRNHRKAHITYGLFYNNELVEIMSFNTNKKYEWEIIRDCSRFDYIIEGGRQKLLSHFIEEYKPNEIFVSCDFNKFNGKIYEDLGMKFIGYTGPDEKYIIKNKVYNIQPAKYKEMKSQVDARIYGAGSKKYLWTK